MNANKIIVLRLEGPLQSWGERALGDTRGSADLPTKSAVVGILACALGLEREDPRILDLCRKVSFAVRADRSGSSMVDYHTVTGNPLRTFAGTKRQNSNTIVTRRTYLQDSVFTVFLETDADTCEEIRNALSNPVWPVYLGRKSCVPTRPVFAEITDVYADARDAIMNYPLSERHDTAVRYEIDTKDDRLLSYTRSDDMAGAHREFGPRRVWKGVLQCT